MTTPSSWAPLSVEAAARRSTKESALVEGSDDWALAEAGPRRGSTSSGADALVTAVAALTAAAGPLPQLSVLPRDSLWVEAPSQRNQQHQPDLWLEAAPRRAAPRRSTFVFFFLPSSSFPQVLGRGLLLPVTIVLDVELQLVDRHVRRDGLDARRRRRIFSSSAPFERASRAPSPATPSGSTRSP